MRAACSTILCACLSLVVCAASAEIQPKYYAQMQASAPEVIYLDVKDVDLEWCLISCESRDVVVQATVVSVERSATGLKTGQAIVVKYVHFSPSGGWVGPRPTPVLQKGKTVAYLSRAAAGHYEPAARGYSFDTVPSETARLPVPVDSEDGGVVEGFFVTDDAPDPQACEVDADCIGDTTLGPNGCCVEPTTIKAHSKKYHAWAGSRRTAPACENVQCPPPPNPAQPAACSFQVRCAEKICTDACR